MQIYRYEHKNGLKDIILKNSSLAYSQQLTLTDNNETALKLALANASSLDEANATNKGQFDLYYLDSILASTGWNDNDDVFVPEEIWAARTTPEDKPLNIEHNQSEIIGHITGTYVIDKDGHAVAEDTDIPQDFHVVTSAVIYKWWRDKTKRDEIETLIAEVKEGDWFVSMECLLANFDYAVITPEGKHHVVARSEDTAFLTKHLRVYGGTGSYDGCKVGRVLRDFVFSGKGLVRKPANPDSVIFANMKSFDASSKEDSFVITQKTMEVDSMADEANVQKVAELQSQLSQAQKDYDGVLARLAELDAEKVEADKKALNDSISERDAEIKTLTEAGEAVKAELVEANEKISKHDEKLAEAKKRSDEAEEKLGEIQVKARNDSRTAQLRAANVDMDDKELTAMVASLDKLDDDAFAKVTALVKITKSAVKSDDDSSTTSDSDDDSSQDDADVNADATVLEDAQAGTTDVALATSSDGDKLEEAQAKLSNFIDNNYLTKDDSGK